MGADTKAIALALVQEGAALKTDFAALKFDDMPGDMLKIVPLVQRAAMKVEEFSAQAGGLSGEEKKDVLVKFLDELIDLPWYLEKFDGPAIDWLIDYAVAGLNKLLGKKWSPFAKAAAGGKE